MASRRLYREYIKQANQLKRFDPVASSVLKYYIRVDLETVATKNQMEEMIQNKQKDLEMIKRANSGDMNGLKRVIRTLCYSNFIKTYPEVSNDSATIDGEISMKLKKDILYNTLRSKTRKIKVSKFELPFQKYIDPDFPAFKSSPHLHSSPMAPNIFSPDAKERFGIDKFDIFINMK
ncbi:unnamed protein product [Moneuplotes crassus]|uniref:LYR motif-containing protein Cup1-like N-terminal domain-containing protein n=1 Tax=Euplotes crassus TaxID=5936 RepID=A0AAD1Y129_EUPCR|nr:unnamed protein product [Moneuplotes crassus]